MGSLIRNTSRARVLFLAALYGGTGIARQDPQLCGSHALRTAEEIALHQRASILTAMAGKSRSVMRVAGRDEGNLFILEDQGDVITRRNIFNLSGRGLAFTPADSAATGYRFELGDARYDADAAARGVPLSGLDDDDSRPLSLPFEFPYFGRAYKSLFLNSDGNLTFGERDDSSADRSVGRATAGLPRISALYRDLDPSRAPGGVRVLLEPERAVFSWVDVPDYQDFGIGPRNTFQIRLYPNGLVEMSFSQVLTLTAVTGIGRGVIQPGDSVLSFSTADSGVIHTGGVVERFTDLEEVDTVLAARRFFESHSDSYDAIAFYNDLGVSPGAGTIAWESTVRNNISGIGDRVADDGSFYGSPTRLQAILNMGPLSQYPDDPLAVVPGRISAGDNSLSVLAHEFGHRWLAFVSVRDQSASGDSPMLGRQSAHWSFAFNSEASLLEGNRIADNGPQARPRFATVAVTEAYSPLDQYLMGLRPASEVPPVFYVANPSILTTGRSPMVGILFDGTRRDVAVQELIDLYGSRYPDHQISQRRFRLAIVLITRAGLPFTDRSIAKVERVRQAFEPYFDRVTGGRASVDTTLRDGIFTTAFPAIAVAQATENEIWVTIPAPRNSDLELSVTAGPGLSAPATVIIPAGETGVRFSLTAHGSGVVDLSVEDPSRSLAPSQAKVRIVTQP